MVTPIRRLVRLNPVSVVIETRSGAPNYDPTAEEDYMPALADLWPVTGAMSGVKQEGGDYDATLTINPEDKPEDLTVDSSRIHLRTEEYGLKAVRPRYLRGEISGYTLELSL